MSKTLALLVTSTALTAAIGLPAWSAMDIQSETAPRPVTAIFQPESRALPLILASDDDDDSHHRKSSKHREDDDNHEDEDEDEDDDHDDDGIRRGANTPAPSGSVTPPANSLFGSGAAPKAQVN